MTQSNNNPRPVWPGWPPPQRGTGHPPDSAPSPVAAGAVPAPVSAGVSPRWVVLAASAAVVAVLAVIIAGVALSGGFTSDSSRWNPGCVDDATQMYGPAATNAGDPSHEDWLAYVTECTDWVDKVSIPGDGSGN